ncbi:hypothetical protein IHE51_01530 [Candidatus Parvarchaeota archaeon]|jgi:hypothetical protein|uniref:Uncharacterized protein n=1 Tax=Candidatus Acidifodinimicrobium mancum TaxID=2898728 RepID=A0A8T3UVZ8_9ARCH|nr:hypothetical protein [Candidatus Acidifodinimicrobium mancum]MBE5728847.1 hypothetical protein [Candidatus Acidifodinimicrobium mancum]MBE5730306.1 hypothetical protein [Candidatus Acidifodinimicrobium mancum]
MEKQRSEQKVSASTRGLDYLNSKTPFILSLSAGIVILAALGILLASNISFITFNSSSITSLESGLNATATQELQILVNATNYMKTAFLLFLPIIGIAGALLIYASVLMLKGNRKKKAMGGVLSIIFGVFTFLALFLLVPTFPVAIATLIGYFGTVGLQTSLSYILFMLGSLLGLFNGLALLYYMSNEKKKDES